LLDLLQRHPQGEQSLLTLIEAMAG
jgi:hypothetical protein